MQRYGGGLEEQRKRYQLIHSACLALADYARQNNMDGAYHLLTTTAAGLEACMSLLDERGTTGGEISPVPPDRQN